MAVFRIEKNSDFTIMPNYPFRDMRLSFKGRGLLGTMLTLRDDWDYTLAGLTAISPHGKSYVSTGLNELERLGYLERRQLREEVYKRQRLYRAASGDACGQKPHKHGRVGRRKPSSRGFGPIFGCLRHGESACYRKIAAHACTFEHFYSKCM